MRFPSPAAWRPLIGPTCLTLLAGTLGGFLFERLGMPAPWMSGALVGTTLLALAPAPSALPEPLRFLSFLILGCSMGAALSPEMLARAATWPVSMGFLAVSVALVMVGVTLFLRRVAGWNLETAFYASIPGALSAVIAMAATTTADMRRVAFAQALRLFLLVAALPHILGAAGSHAPRVAAETHATALGPLVLLIAAALCGGLIFARLRVPGGILVGAMAASAVLHATGLSDAQIPNLLLIPSFIILGAGVGLRFKGTDMRTLRESVFASLGAVVVAVGISVVFALLAAWITGEEAGKMVTAFAPGALETMTVLGFALGYDPAFMSAHHLFRFAGLSIAMPLLAHLLFSMRRER
ncbi:MAG: hypothetical protein B7Z15_01330 [Rhizobiales bacterium 32-66-8]|nr:MAG: hypothetical protein B7Z15_01330 [Rhizobiales bacterium 32-66-8]